MFEVQQDMLQALACCSSQDQCIRCSYRKYGQNCDLKLREDALVAISQLQQERDTAVSDMKQAQGCICQICKQYYRPNPKVRRYECRILGDFKKIDPECEGALVCGQFEWRGLQQKDDEA